MLEQATVTRVHDGCIDVAIVPSAACVGCDACSEKDGVRHLTGVSDSFGADVGDTVEVSTPAPARYRAQGLVYIAPVAAVLFGYLAGFLLSGSVDVDPDTGGAVLGMCSGAAMLLALWFIDRNAAGSDRYEPRVRAIISRGHNVGKRP